MPPGRERRRTVIHVSGIYIYASPKGRKDRSRTGHRAEHRLSHAKEAACKRRIGGHRSKGPVTCAESDSFRGTFLCDGCRGTRVQRWSRKPGAPAELPAVTTPKSFNSWWITFIERA